MKAVVKKWVDALAKFDNTDLAELEKVIKELRSIREEEEEKNKAIQNFKKAYFELCEWVDIYYDYDIDGYGLVYLEDANKFSFE